MTLREKVKQTTPEFVDERYIGGVWLCPHCYGLETKDERPCKNYQKITFDDCTKCWNREEKHHDGKTGTGDQEDPRG